MTPRCVFPVTPRIASHVVPISAPALFSFMGPPHGGWIPSRVGRTVVWPFCQMKLRRPAPGLV
jgi:hypothetical protein